MATQASTRTPAQRRQTTDPVDEALHERIEFETKHYDSDAISVKNRRGAIRILVLESGAPSQKEVKCKLIRSTILFKKHQLPDDPDQPPFQPYDALSWSWGREPLSDTISIIEDGRTYIKYVQPKLVAALRALRFRYKARFLWVDAICINQLNEDEKNVQVEMMSMIYGRANCARIWLGAADESSDMAIAFIKEKILHLQHFDNLMKSDNSDNWIALMNFMQRDWFSRRWVIQEVTLAKRAFIHCGKAELAWEQFAVAVELFVEVETATHRLSEVMETDAKHRHVPQQFEYISQSGASLLVDATGKLFRDYDYSKRETASLNSHAIVQSLASSTNNRGHEPTTEDSVAQADAISAASIGELSDEQEGMKTQPLLTLEYLVSSMSIFGVSHAHDCVYALLGIAKDTTPLAVTERLGAYDNTQKGLEMFTARKHYPVDYNAEYIDICKDFVEFCIRQNIRRDPSRAADVLCRPWALEVQDKKHQLSLPSWLARLQGASHGMVLLPRSEGQGMGRINADSLVGLPISAQRNYNAAGTKGLNTKVFRFRKRQVQSRMPVQHQSVSNGTLGEVPVINTSAHTIVAQASPTNSEAHLPDAQVVNADAASNPVLTPRSPKKSVKINGSLLPAASQATHRLSMTDPVYNHFSLYIEGFVLDIVFDKQPASQGGMIPADWAKFARWDVKGTPPDRFWRTLVADRGADGRNPPVYYSRACQESFRKGGLKQGAVNTVALIEEQRNSVVAQFCRRVQAAIWNRQLIKTEKNGRLGLVAGNVDKDDLLCILYGCSVPVVLRRHGPKSDDAVEYETWYELQHIYNRLADSYLVHLQRRKTFATKREADKRLYKIWEDERRKEWRNDKDWKVHWSMVRSGIKKVHEFRLWARKAKQDAEGRPNQALTTDQDDDITTASRYVDHVLPQIHELAKWAAGLDEQNEMFLDRLAQPSRRSTVPKRFALDNSQIQLWNKFKSDGQWRTLWSEQNILFESATVARMKHQLSALKTRQEIRRLCRERQKAKTVRIPAVENGTDHEHRQSSSVENEEHAQQQLEEWMLENSWFLCIDSFRAWLKEHGKMRENATVMPYKQKWDVDESWQTPDEKKKLQSESFQDWIKARKLHLPELGHFQTKTQLEQFDEWRAKAKHVDYYEVNAAWAKEWARRQRSLDDERRDTEKKRTAKLENERFYEVWRKGWKPPVTNWSEFEIAVSYGRYWVSFVKKRMKSQEEKAGASWKSPEAIKDRQRTRAKLVRENYGMNNISTARDTKAEGPASSVPPQRPLLHQSNSAAEDEASNHDNSMTGALVSRALVESNGELFAEHQVKGRLNGPHNMSKERRDIVDMPDTSIDDHVNNIEDVATKSGDTVPASDLGVNFTEPQSSHGPAVEAQSPFTDDPSIKPLQRSQTSAQHQQDIEEDERQKWHETFEQMILQCERSDLKCLTPDDLDWWIDEKRSRHSRPWKKAMKAAERRYEAWKVYTPVMLGKDNKYYFDRRRVMPKDDDSEETIPALMLRTANRRTNPEKAEKCRYGVGHYVVTKVRERPDEEKGKEFLENAMEAYRARVGNEGQYWYELLGECYIDGMMDGEAMAYQNDEGVPARVFEIR